MTSYVLFFIHLESRRVDIAVITAHPDELWMRRIARNVTLNGCGILRTRRYILHDRGTKTLLLFRTIIPGLKGRRPRVSTAHRSRWIEQGYKGKAKDDAGIGSRHCRRRTRFAVLGPSVDLRVCSFRIQGMDLGHVSTRKLHDRGVPVIDRVWTGQHGCTGRLRVDQCFGKFLDFVTSKLVPIRIG